MKKNAHKILFCCILLIGTFLRLFTLELNSLWLDEIWSMNASSSTKTAWEIIEICKGDTHPPLFDIILNWALKIFNDAEFTGRYLAFFLGIIGMLATYLYANKISSNKKIALIAFGIVSLNYFHVIYSFEGRFYTLIYLLSLGCLAELYLFIKNNKIKSLVAFFIYAISILYTHYYGAILLLSLGIAIVILWLLKNISTKVFLKFLLTSILIVIAFTPWVPFVFAKSGTTSWMSTPKLIEFYKYYETYTGNNWAELIVLFLPLLLFFIKHKNHRQLSILLYACILLGFLIPYTASILYPLYYILDIPLFIYLQYS